MKTSLPLQSNKKQWYSILKKLVQKIESIIPSAYVFLSYESIEKTAVTVHNIESISQEIDQGVIARIHYNQCNYEFATNQFHDLTNQIMPWAEEISRIPNQNLPSYQPLMWQEELKRDLSPFITKHIPKQPSADTPIHFGTEFLLNPLEEDTQTTISKLQQLRSRTKELNPKEEPELASILWHQSIKRKDQIFVDRQKIMSQSLLYSLSHGSFLTQKGQSTRIVQGGLGGLECCQVHSDDITKKVSLAHKLDHAKKIKPGSYRVLTGPDVTGVIAHEAFGHTQEGDTCRYGRSCAPELATNQTVVGNKHATIINNAAVFEMDNCSWGQNGSHYFDDEGQLAREQVILNEGLLSSPMNDLMSAIKTQKNRESNGKRESWKRPIMARQTNTYFSGGDSSFEELLQKMQNGFIAIDAHGGMEDPKGMRLTAGTSYLIEVKNGSLTENIYLGPRGGHIELNGYVPDLLHSILGKSKLSTSNIPLQKWGGCGKYHKELVQAGSGGPWILWDGMICG